MRLERDVEVSHEAGRLWSLKFGSEYARRLYRNRGRGGDAWHPDGVFVKINGRHVYPWRGVDQEGQVLDILIQKRRDKKLPGGSSGNCSKVFETFPAESSRTNLLPMVLLIAR